MRLLVSACLLGLCTRYDGKHQASEQMLALRNRHELIPVCPEQLGGLPTPRPPCELRDGRIISQDGADRTAEFERGAEQALRIFQLTGCQAAVLKARSPSCGKGPVYDGTFSGRLKEGEGVFAKSLKDLGIPLFDESEAINL